MDKKFDLALFTETLYNKCLIRGNNMQIKIRKAKNIPIAYRRKKVQESGKMYNRAKFKRGE